MGVGNLSYRGKLLSWLDNLSRRRRLFLAFLAGILMAFSMPPFHFFPAIFVSFPLFMALLNRVEGKVEAAFLGWLFGFGFLLLGLYWVSFSMLTEIERYWWVMPFSTPALPAGLAVLCPFVGFLYVRFKGVFRGSFASEAMFLALLWSMQEWLRGTIFTGFPWNLLAHAWDGSLAMQQSVWVFGTYGLSFLTGAIALLLGGFWVTERGNKAALWGVFGVVLLFVGGVIRLHGYEMQNVPNVILRLVQPNITQIDKWDPAQIENHFNNLMELSIDGAKEAGVTDVIWPETAISPRTFMEENLSIAVPDDGALITGMQLREYDDDARQYDYYNGLIMIDDEGDIVDSYNKHHLVPFGEYMPFRGFLGLDSLAAGTSDFSSGDGAAAHGRGDRLPKFSPLICYEAIFPGRAVAVDDDESRWLLNITNDAWFDNTAGPYQHFAISRLRAIEEGMPLVRVANTGITAVIDPMGRIVDALPIGERGSLDVVLPKALDSTGIYKKTRGWVLAILWIKTLLFFWLVRFLRRKA